MQQTFVPLKIASYWEAVQNDLLAIVDLIPDGQMGYSPKPALWNFQGLLLHTASAREEWLSDLVRDGGESVYVWKNVRTRDETKSALERTWKRLQAFLSNAAQLDATYRNETGGEAIGHRLAFGLLEHDIHHRADMLHYLAMLDVDCSSMSFQ